MALTKVSTDGVKDDAITKTKIPANQIEASEIAAGAVTEAKLDTNAVTTNKIANSAINQSKLADASINAAKIQDQQVTLAKLPHGTSSNDGKFLRANNGADPTFETVSGTTINNNADNRVITGSGTANTLEGESNLTFDGSNLAISGELDVFKASGFGDIFHVRGNSTNTVVAKIENAYTTDNDRFAVLEIKSGKCQLRFQSNGDTTEGAITYNMADNTMAFGVNNASEKLRIQSGGGISFNGDTAAANALDDYEQGTFTPTIKFGTTSATSYYNQQGVYTKIGRIVHVQIHMNINNMGSGTGNAIVEHLPFSVGNIGFGYFAPMGIRGRINSGSNNEISAYVSQNSTQLYIYRCNHNGFNSNTTLTHSNFATQSEVDIMITYPAA